VAAEDPPPFNGTHVVGCGPVQKTSPASGSGVAADAGIALIENRPTNNPPSTASFLNFIGFICNSPFL
jgi:hypothetical protein